jgi:uncharacterized protein (TIGR02231 family)
MSTPPSPARAPLAVDAPVVQVTVLEDRAQVVRRARVELPAGVSTLAIAGLAPVLSDKSLGATLAGPGAASVPDVTLARRRMTDDAGIAASAEVAALRARLRELRQAHERLDGRAGQLGSERDQLAAIRGHTLAELAADVAHGRDATADARAALDQLDRRDGELRQQQVALAHEQALSGQRINDVQRQLHALATSDRPLRASATLMVTAAVAGSYELRLTYVVPGACWRPAHTARLDGEDGAAATVHLASEAWVWQHTGEDWSGVELLLSTERASLGTEPPELSADELHLRRKEAGTVVAAREQVVEDTGGGGAKAQEVPGIDDGGEVRVLRPAGMVDVPADGRPRRFALGGFSAPAELALVLMAERAPAAILRTTLANGSGRPLLAGPVDLIRRGGLAGRTTLRFVAAGARFELGGGPDPDLRVQRRHDSNELKAGLLALAAWPATAHRVQLEISNLGPVARQLQVIERLPVSELDQVVIEPDAAATRPAAAADRDGLVRWTVSVPARGHAELALGWTLKRHPEVVGL